MSVVKDEFDRAIVTDMVTGEVFSWAPPTAIENVTLAPERYCHGKSDKRVKLDAAPAAPVEAPVALRQDDVLDLPTGEVGVNDTALTDAEINADLEALGVNFHPSDETSQRLALRNDARAARDAAQPAAEVAAPAPVAPKPRTPTRRPKTRRTAKK
jgi:hypothetical protein